MYAKSAAHQKHAEQPARAWPDAGRAGLASGATGRLPAGPARGRRRAWHLLALAAGSALGALACAEGGAGPAEAVGEGEFGIEGGRIASDATEVVRVDYVSETPGMVSMGVSCSGVIIAPNLVLTARHCVSPRSVDGACEGQGSFGPVSDAPMVVRVQTPSGALVEVPVEPGSRVVADTSEKSCGPDLALLFVPKLADYRNEPWFWVASPRLDRAVKAGETYAAIGFGDANAKGDGSGERRERANLGVQCVGEGCNTQGISDREWMGKAGVCGGDSGGPAIDERGRVIGIVSRGNPNDCNGPIYTSVFAWREWLTEQALLAAQRGQYSPPPWTTRVAPPGDDGNAEAEAESEGGCSLGPAPGAGRVAPWAAALALAALAGARRRRPG